MRSLQSARALAAVLVVYFHSVLQISHIAPDDSVSIGSVFPLFGKSGVDVFFVLSGLLIWRSTARPGGSILDFYGKRLMRIVPLYWILTLTAAALALAAPSLLRSTRFDCSHLIASLLFLPWPNPASHGSLQDLMTPLIVPGWTLNFEIFFYATFGLCLLLPLKIRPLVTLLLFTLVIGTILRFRAHSATLAFYDPSLILEFILGIATAYIIGKGRCLPPIIAFPALAISVSALIFCDLEFSGADRLLISGLPAALILYSLVSLEMRKRWPCLHWTVIIGDATYSIYLTHIFVLAGFRIIFTKIDFPLESGVSQGLFVVMALTACILTGLLTYYGVERPIGKGLKHISQFRHSSHKPASGTVG